MHKTGLGKEPRPENESFCEKLLLRKNPSGEKTSFGKTLSEKGLFGKRLVERFLRRIHPGDASVPRQSVF
jgi:hypothetical protein